MFGNRQVHQGWGANLATVGADATVAYQEECQFSFRGFPPAVGFSPGLGAQDQGQVRQPNRTRLYLGNALVDYPKALPDLLHPNPKTVVVVPIGADGDIELHLVVGVVGLHLARDLGNEPANKLYPEEYGIRALAWAKGKDNVEVDVWDYERLHSEKMEGVIAVGKGSIHKPCMVFFRLNPRAQSDEKVPCIVGKGITFDTGGISLKAGAKMDEMKFDMHGSATVFGLFQGLHATGYEGRVNGITCMAENMPSAEAYRPGDVIDTYSGKTIEVLNTDAEGRNVLADGLWKAGELNPSYIIDLATLTGACVVALGHEASGLWSNDDGLRERIQQAGESEDEIAWPMPLMPAFEKEMTGSKIADVRNLGTARWGGANTAAAFLKQFVQECEGEDGEMSQIPWAHLDIAGPAWRDREFPYTPKGASGVGVRLLAELVADWRPLKSKKQKWA